ncbi:MAG: PBP1A family penicillin-binding protein [Candidatus Moranbacteria bacterium]|nr:PBP1A family penicillin-binding protein [Candidatus Moranbacteria bacterium]
MLGKTIKITGALLFLALLISIFTAVSFGYGLYQKSPSVKGVSNIRMQQTSVIYDRTGENVLYEIHGTEDRKLLDYEQMPASIKIATLAAEDNDFFSHNGFDLASILRAAKVNLENKKTLQGASTITQQLAREFYLTREKTYERKIKEIILAVKLEKAFSKEEILEMYLNKITYGSDVYGIQSAAEEFFGKDAKDLTLDEAALLASLPKAPSLLSPYGENVSKLKQRQLDVLKKIEELGLVKKEMIEEAIQANTIAKIIPKRDNILAPHFVFHVIDQLEKRYGKEFVQEGGLEIITTLDLDMQQAAQETVNRGAIKNDERWNAENAALVAMKPGTGEVLAMAGSRDYFDSRIDGQVNVTTRPRQPGSSFKPVVYAAAFEKGFQPETKLHDVKTDFGPDGSGKNYIPRNYTGKFHGILSMREALAGSINVPAVKTLYLAGIDDTIELGKRMGIDSLEKSKYYGLSLALGSAEITLLEEVSAYSVFANKGEKVSPAVIGKVIDSSGQVIYERQPLKEKIIEAETAAKINSILSDKQARRITFGSNQSLEITGREVAAKTGTTQDYRDGWTVGYTPSLAVGVWAGNNDNTPMKAGAAGVYVAAPIWKEFFTQAIASYPKEEFDRYQKVKSDKLMLTGEVEEKTEFYNKKTGKKIESKEKLEKTDPDKIRTKNTAEPHSLLYYINKSSPLEADPNKNDPMLERWEKSLNNDSEDGDDD